MNDGHIYISNPPGAAELVELYSKEYFEGKSEVGYRSNVFLNQDSHLRRSKRRLKKIQRFSKGGKILDVGCGPGYFLASLPDTYEVYGADISQSAADFALENFKIKIWVGDFLKMPGKNNFFDIVTMFSQLEHTVDPRKTLEKVRNMLVSKGILILSLPNINGVPRYIMGKNWRGFSIPEHLHFFNPENLNAILKQTGFEPIKSGFSEKNFTRDTNYFYARKAD